VTGNIKAIKAVFENIITFLISIITFEAGRASHTTPVFPYNVVLA
jgi:hypothetical protein